MMRKKILTLALFVGATFLLAATAVLAASPGGTNFHPTLQPTATPTPIITNPVAAMIALFFGHDPALVQEWHDEGLGDGEGIGYGNMTTALFFAEASGSSFEEIMALRAREEGGGWGYIIKELGLDIRRRDTNLGAIMSGRVVTETEPVTETVQGTARPERGPKETPPGWVLGKGQGRGRGQNRGHGKGQNK